MSTAEYNLEKNKISDSVLLLIKSLEEDKEKSIHWFYDDDNYDNHLATTISQITEAIYTKEVARGQESVTKNGQKEIIRALLQIQDCLIRIVKSEESGKEDYPTWGELTGIMENIQHVFVDKVDKEIIDNLSDTIRNIKIPRRSFFSASLEKDKIQSLKTAIGYIDGLTKLLN